MRGFWSVMRVSQKLNVKSTWDFQILMQIPIRNLKTFKLTFMRYPENNFSLSRLSKYSLYERILECYEGFSKTECKVDL
jgi:hypothetical protein